MKKYYTIKFKRKTIKGSSDDKTKEKQVLITGDSMIEKIGEYLLTR